MKVSQAMSCEQVHFNSFHILILQEGAFLQHIWPSLNLKAHLNAFVCFVHELKEFVHNRLEEPPVGPEEPRVLPHYVHDVGCDDCLRGNQTYLRA